MITIQLDPWLNIHSHARAMMIEQIMAVYGRASKDPARYRRILESQETATLERSVAQIRDGSLATRPLSLSETTHP